MNHVYSRLAGAALLASLAMAQPAARAPQPPQFISPEVHPDRKVTFRLYAPKAEEVRFSGNDIPGVNQGPQMTKGENGVWSVTIGPIDPGAYRYNFNVAGVATIDPRNPSTSESNNNTWSLVTVAGSPFMDTRQVPHGAVAAITYYSTALQRFRRMHVYTPPGYEMGKDKFPVFYLLHGAGDCDESWTSVGRAGIILDNLIADRKAKPMIVVMPAGHTSSGGFRVPSGADEFYKDFTMDIMPYVEKNYRVMAGRANRAIAGLSMGGNQTLAVAIPNLEKFAYVGVYSSGLIGMFNTPRAGAPAPAAAAPAAPPAPSWEQQNKAALENTAAKKGLKLLWFATGKDDFLLKTTHGTVELFKKYGFNPEYEETAGGHTWINWRNYLNTFAQRLF